jgi:hypothetical protein
LAEWQKKSQGLPLLSRGLNNILLFGFLICAGAVLLLISPEERQ